MNNSKTYDNLLVFVIHEIFFFLKNFVPFDLIVQHDEQWKKHTVPPERRKTKEKRKKNERKTKKEKKKKGKKEDKEKRMCEQEKFNDELYIS